MILIFLTILGCGWISNSLTGPAVITDRVGLIELNHQYSYAGRYTYSQIIFWEFDPSTRRKHVRDWTLLEPSSPIEKCPLKNIDTGIIESKWIDDKGVSRVVTSPDFLESWTQEDPERMDKKRWHESRREGLTQPKKKHPETVAEPEPKNEPEPE